MSRPTQNIKGTIRGLLTVLERGKDKISIRNTGTVRRDTQWKCQCICGKIKTIAADPLIAGRVKSCGSCLHQKPGQAFRQVVRVYKYGARRRGVKFNLTDEQVKKLFSSDCFYCGSKPNNVSSANWIHRPEKMVYSGIDRRNNALGYSVKNCVPCCRKCNWCKRMLDDKEFIDLCKIIARRHQ